MGFASLTQFRSVTNFTISEISDDEVNDLLSDADRALIRLSTTEVYLEKLEGNIDGSNVDFKTKFSPLADSDASGSVDKDDVTVYYATYDSVTNWIELGSAQTVSSVQSKEGIITMSTAPTETTAEAGVYVIYRYESQGVLSTDIYKLAACYFLAYMVANKIKGLTAQHFSIEEDLRKQIADTDWLKLCYETLGLQDKLFLDAPQGMGIPEMSSSNSSRLNW